MSGCGHSRPWRCFSLSLAVAALSSLSAQPSREEPQLLDLRLSAADLQVEAEQKNETRKTEGSDDSFSEDSRYIAPSAGFTVDGSVYHPNFLKFNLSAEVGLNHLDDHSTGGTNYDSSGDSFLQSYNANVLFLQEKPYNASLFANKNDFRREYDFFTTVDVESQRYGGRAGYSAGPLPFSVSAYHLDETTKDAAQPSSLDEDVASFAAHNARPNEDVTDFSYTYDRFNRQDQGASVQDGTQHSLRASDGETFGQRGQLKLDSALFYDDIESSATPSRDLTADELLTIRHRENLESLYDYGYSRSETGDATDERNSAKATLRHRLYESLVSAPDVHAERERSTGADSSYDTTIYGAGLNEDYSKHLGAWGRLAIGYHGRLDQEQHDTTGGQISVIREQHTLTDDSITFLDHADVDATTIEVTDSDGVRIYLADFDYVAVAHGSVTEIRRVLGGAIANGSSVLVSYTATAQPSTNFRTAANQFSARLDLFGGLFGLYARWSQLDYYGDADLTDQAYVDSVFGIDSNWRWLRTGAEYEGYASNLSPYQSRRLYESFFFQFADASTLGIDMEQSWTTFPEEDTDHDVYSFIGRYNRMLTASMSASVEGGHRVEHGQDYERQLDTVRSEITYAIGQFDMRLSYELQDETYLGDTRDRSIVYLKARRRF